MGIFTLEDEKKIKEPSVLLFPDHDVLQYIYDSLKANKDALNSAINNGENGFKLKRFQYSAKEILKDVPLSPDALAVVKVKKGDVLNRKENIDVEIKQSDSLISEIAELIEDAEVKHTLAIVADDRQLMDDIELRVKDWRNNINLITARKKSYKKSILIFEGIEKTLASMIKAISEGLRNQEVEEAQKIYDKHLQEFAKHFKEFNQVIIYDKHHVLNYIWDSFCK